MKQLYPIPAKAIVLSVLLLLSIFTHGLSQYSKLLDFDGINTGSYPAGSLTISGNILYGMTNNGGLYAGGVIFKINTDGSEFKKIFDFDINTGRGPAGSLTLAGSVLYGLTYSGGPNNLGVLFKINTDGTEFKRLVDFDGISKGSYPTGSLILYDNLLYGMTELGGATNNGVIFKVKTDGSEFKKLVDFDGLHKGSTPYGDLSLVDTRLFGMTSQGGTNNWGAIFSVNNDSTGFKKLFDFDGDTNGSYPIGSLTLDGSVLFGMTGEGGAKSLGVLFKENANGTGFTKLVDFDDSINKGSNPLGTLTLSDTTLYGLTAHGGANGKGIMFKVSTDGSGFTKLVDFDGTNKGSNPIGSFMQSGNTLYAMTGNGGVNKKGVVFKYFITNETTSIGYNTHSDYRVFPNPFHECLTIRNDLTMIKKIVILTIYGQLVIAQPCNSNEVNLNTSAWTDGTYIIKVYDKTGEISTTKVIKQ